MVAARAEGRLGGYDAGMAPLPERSYFGIASCIVFALAVLDIVSGTIGTVTRQRAGAISSWEALTSRSRLAGGACALSAVAWASPGICSVAKPGPQPSSACATSYSPRRVCCGSASAVADPPAPLPLALYCVSCQQSKNRSTGQP
jgi:hypothetical protein